MAGDLKVYIAGAIADAGRLDEPHARGGQGTIGGAVAMRGGRVLAAGAVDFVLERAGSDAQRVDLPGRLLLPGLVNVHGHLDLTDLPRVPYDGDFIAWVASIMAQTRTAQYDRGAATQRGAALSRDAGVLTVGDIAASPDSTEALIESPLRGVSYIEQFGIGIDFVSADEVQQTLLRWEDADESAKVRIGLQPHAPYSAGPELYELAARFNRDYDTPISTHLAETLDELEFVATSDGPFRGLLEDMGKWKESYRGLYNEGLHPVFWLLRSELLDRPRRERPRWLLAHCNHVGEEHIERLAACGASVAYCPRASDYFAHYDHPYLDLLDADVNVALGTDSIACHGSLSILDEMRHLYARDKTDPALLLEMATVHGMTALGLDPDSATFSTGHRPGLLAVEYDPKSNVAPLLQILKADDPPNIDVYEDAG